MQLNMLVVLAAMMRSDAGHIEEMSFASQYDNEAEK